MRSLSQLRLLSSLPEVARLTVLTLTEGEVTAADQDGLAAALQKAQILPPVPHPIHVQERPLALLGTAGRRLLRGLPYLAGKWWSGEILRTLRRQISGEGYDLFYIDHLGMAVYLPELRTLCPWARVVLEEHNVESEFFAQFAERQPAGWRARLARSEQALAERFEREALQRADAVVAISAVDAAKLEALCGVRPVVVPPVVELEAAGPSTAAPARPEPAGPPALGYLGNLSWHPNVQGLDWLCQEVWPRVRRRLPEARLLIAGSGLPMSGGQPLVPPAWRGPGVSVLGYVADPEALYQQVLGMAAPVFGGSGVRIKLLESLRAGMPTLTTSAGALGLPLRSGEEVLIADQPEAFAEAVARLCEGAGLRRHLRQQGHHYLRAHHSLRVAQAALRRALRPE